MTIMGMDFNSIDLEQAKKEQEHLAKNHAMDLRPYLKTKPIQEFKEITDKIDFTSIDPIMANVVEELAKAHADSANDTVDALVYACDAYNDQTIKADVGKEQLHLVPMQILRDIAVIRKYGNDKYGDSDSWKRVAPERYIDAMLRHAIAFVEDPKSVDEESKLAHLWHLATNVAFLCWFFAKGAFNDKNK
jgi:hypothetical protein